MTHATTTSTLTAGPVCHLCSRFGPSISLDAFRGAKRAHASDRRFHALTSARTARTCAFRLRNVRCSVAPVQNAPARDLRLPKIEV